MLCMGSHWLESRGEDTSRYRWACTSPQEAASAGWWTCPRRAMPVIVAKDGGAEMPSPIIAIKAVNMNKRWVFILFFYPQFFSKSKGWPLLSFTSIFRPSSLAWIPSTAHPAEIWAENIEWWMAAADPRSCLLQLIFKALTLKLLRNLSPRPKIQNQVSMNLSLPGFHDQELLLSGETCLSIHYKLLLV